MRAYNLTILLGIFVSAQVASPQCRNWTDVLTQSFLANRANPESLRQLSMLTPENYKAEKAADEVQVIQQILRQVSPSSQALPHLRSRLREFYQIGAQLYGVSFEPERLYVLPDMELNAFATGHHIFFYEGLILYYLDPIQFLVNTGRLPRQMTREQYLQVSQTFNWRNDWESLYFVLAHEAGHNLMAHGDESALESVRSQLQQFAGDAKAHRKAVAEGKAAPGVRHYLGRGLRTFLSGPARSEQEVKQEEESDSVASEILRRAGLRPDSGLTWLQRMAVLDGPTQTNWQTILTKAFCSTHPDTPRRMSNLQRSLSCLQFGGKLCEGHRSYPLPERMQMIRSEMSSVERYIEETVAVAEGRVTPTSAVSQTVELKPNPDEARLDVDGLPVSRGKITLASGRHVLTASRDGYRTASLAFAVFPDVKATIKFKLKKCDKGKPCEPEQPQNVAAESASTAAPQPRLEGQQAAESEAEEDRRPYLKRKN